MESSTRTGHGFTSVIACAIILAAVTGCATKLPVAVKTQSETELAVAAIRSEWLKHCAPVAGGMPENQVGALLQDYADLAASSAACRELHNSLVEYLAPVVKKERGN